MTIKMFSAPPKNVAIVGAGLAGLALAISLHRKGISSTIYELREPTITTPGALMLSPNALYILDTLGLYDRLKPQGFNFESIAFKNHDGVTTDTYYLGDEKLYRYKALRIYRQVLLTELRAEVKRLQIPITYGLKYSHIISEDDNGVTFVFTNGTSVSADLLVGADGIHSTVRKHIAPGVVPKYGGLVAITCAIQKSSLTFPEGTTSEDYPMPVSIHSKNGAFVMAPQNVDGSEVLAGTQRAWPEQDRAGWDAFLANKSQLLELFRTDIQDWPEIVQSALNNVSADSLSIWPFYIVPKLDHWFSPAKRVIILGDAAHAIPPTAGQGASQGFEDAFTLAALLSGLAPNLPLEKALTTWKNTRQQRVDNVVKLTLQLNAVRLPQAERDALAAQGKLIWQTGADGELAWLYNADVEKEILDLVDAEKSK